MEGVASAAQDFWWRGAATFVECKGVALVEGRAALGGKLVPSEVEARASQAAPEQAAGFGRHVVACEGEVERRAFGGHETFLQLASGARTPLEVKAVARASEVGGIPCRADAQCAAALRAARRL